MNLFEPTTPLPAVQLATDEALLDWCEAGHGGEAMTFWEPAETFVVVGYANKVAREVNVAACEARGVPIFRRCSGGGAVVQMPGGLNYSLILRIDENGPTRNISSANQFIMRQNAAALQSALPLRGAFQVAVKGHTDLALVQPDGTIRKFAGNSQRRLKRFLLFHGTLLLNCDLSVLRDLLPMPSLQPDYRGGRTHDEFVTNLGLSAESVKAALARAWGATETPASPPLEEIEKLAREKYAARDWNHKF
jgi:lipoate-protein ligase A